MLSTAPLLSTKTLEVLALNIEQTSPNMFTSDGYGHISFGQDVYTFFKRPALTRVAATVHSDEALLQAYPAPGTLPSICPAVNTQKLLEASASVHFLTYRPASLAHATHVRHSQIN